ncbi:hypothetical protein [Pumilibacter intestinalis]|uniref:hypothetical protein n=1 Tax=Pumilibacter intestinalis TaxID=2941511 RepID=UPI00203CC484|nr:hypothetical protein [Pumilibacter intestinalis]
MKYAINKENEIIWADDYNPRNQWLEKLLCPCCKEPVKFVRESAGDRYRTAHFRHKSGKKSQDCELYIPFSGSYNIGNIKRSQLATDNLAMCVNVKNNFFQFYIAITFSEEDLIDYESQQATFKLSYWANERPFNETRLINHAQFSANHQGSFPLNIGCKDVLFSINNTEKTISCANNTTYYRINEAESDDDSIWARQIEKDSLTQSLYIGERYVLVVPKYSPLRDIYHIIQSITTVSTYDLYIVEIKEYNDKTIEICESQGYNLKEVREQFGILWPPVKNNNGYFEANSNNLCVMSNIELESGKNINFDSLTFEDDVYYVCFDRGLTISGELKNIRCVFVESSEPIYNALRIETVICKEVSIDSAQYYAKIVWITFGISGIISCSIDI